MEQEPVDSMDLVIAEYRKDVDVGLIEWSLSKTPDERMQWLVSAAEFSHEAHEARKKALRYAR